MLQWIFCSIENEEFRFARVFTSDTVIHDTHTKPELVFMSYLKLCNKFCQIHVIYSASSCYIIPTKTNDYLTLRL